MPSPRRVRDLVIFARSKNAGPFMLTIDLFFASAEDCGALLRSGILGADAVASVYRIDANDIRVIHVPQANAIKISFPRPIIAGDLGDCDVAGGQQFAPLLDLMTS